MGWGGGAGLKKKPAVYHTPEGNLWNSPNSTIAISQTWYAFKTDLSFFPKKFNGPNLNPENSRPLSSYLVTILAASANSAGILD
jgi:hypothetical protein